MGEPQKLSPALARDLAAVRSCWEETAGAFDPAIGALVRAWGLRTGGRRPVEVERRAAMAAGDFNALRLEDGGRGDAAITPAVPCTDRAA